MSALVRAELLKLRTTRVPLALVLALLALVAFAVVATLVTAHDDVLDDEGWRRDLVNTADLASLFAFLLGMLLATSEYRHSTITPTFLVTPVRRRVVLAKLVGGPLAALPLAAAAIVVTLAISAPWLAARGAALEVGGDDLGPHLGRVLLAAALWGGLGVAIGALVRNQVAAIVGTLAWLIVVEPLLAVLESRVGRYGLGGVLDGLGGTGGEDALSFWAAAALGTGYVLAIGLAAIVVTERRDVS